MAHTAHRDKLMMEELVEPTSAIEAKAKEVAVLIRQSRHVVFFTGAGISTATGIADYRGPNGVWTAAAQNKTVPSKSMLSAVPSFTHMALATLIQQQRAHYIISQNVDGLHRRSGVPSTAIAELHGNSTLEACNACGKVYMRDYYIYAAAGDHFSGRKCSARGCNGLLRDTIINFGENLPTIELNNGFLHSDQAELHICLGSSLTVAPACDMPKATKKKGGKVVIVNLQRTPMDSIADVRVHCKIDEFIFFVMRELGISVPQFTLKKTVALWTAVENSLNLFVAGVDADGVPQSLFSSISVVGGPTVDTATMDPACITLPSRASDVQVECNFFGHLAEPTVRIAFPASKDPEQFTCYNIEWDFSCKEAAAKGWTVTKADGSVRPPSYSKGNGNLSRIDGISQPRDAKNIPAHNYAGWFAVSPIEHCEHCEGVRFQKGTVLDLLAPCKECANVGENMQCLTCFEVHCGRHVKQHMVAHHESTQHPMVVGFADLSFWCYPCEAYVSPSNKHLGLIYHLMHQSKFHEEPGSS